MSNFFLYIGPFTGLESRLALFFATNVHDPRLDNSYKIVFTLLDICISMRRSGLDTWSIEAPWAATIYYDINTCIYIGIILSIRPIY